MGAVRALHLHWFVVDSEFREKQQKTGCLFFTITHENCVRSLARFDPHELAQLIALISVLKNMAAAIPAMAKFQDFVQPTV